MNSRGAGRAKVRLPHPRDVPLPQISVNRELVRSVSVIACYPRKGAIAGIGLRVITSKERPAQYDICRLACDDANRTEDLPSIAWKAIHEQAGLNEPILMFHQEEDKVEYFLRGVGYNELKRRIVFWYDRRITHALNYRPNGYVVVDPASLRRQDLVPDALEDITTFMGYCASHGMMLPWLQGMTKESARPEPAPLTDAKPRSGHRPFGNAYS